jgi:phage head maturation protease
MRPDDGVPDRAVQPRHVECSVVGVPARDRCDMAATQSAQTAMRKKSMRKKPRNESRHEKPDA